MTVGAKFGKSTQMGQPSSQVEFSIEVSNDDAEYHVNDQEPFYDCGSSIAGENSLIQMQD